MECIALVNALQFVVYGDGATVRMANEHWIRQTEAVSGTINDPHSLQKLLLCYLDFLRII
jgi:hypothetical protein